ncbi:MAG: carboxypeptidase regulatory-like domain-containing protein [Candidatus Cloacimonetes bacterium]|nr:carboxypeptidase regulatory-like domain-containing protein [Candidatus Cloacimonadota bacterium]
MRLYLILIFLGILTLPFADVIWQDNFEELTGWILNGEFEIDQPQGLGGEYGNPDPQTAYSGSNVLGVDLTGLGASMGDYESDLGLHEYFAISPLIDCSEFVSVELNMMKWLNVEQPAYDHAYVSVSNDNGTTWIDIWTNTNQVTDNSWQSAYYDISEIADLNSGVRIRFSIGTTDGSWQFSGWNIDNIIISGIPVTYGTIEGDVSNSYNGEPVSFVSVMSQYGATLSDETGYFILNSIPTGNREIIINAPGFLPYTQNNIVVTDNDTTYVTCELEPDPDTPPSPQNLQTEIYDGNNVHLTWEAAEYPIEELLAFNIYRNGFIISSVILEEYNDVNLVNGIYNYYISAVYDAGESLPCDPVNVQINTTGNGAESIPLPEFALSNYPNPFNPTTTITYSTPQLYSSLCIKIFNIKGQIVKTIPVRMTQAGNKQYSVIWNGKDDSDKLVTSGIYLYYLQINGQIKAMNKMMILK